MSMKVNECQYISTDVCDPKKSALVLRSPATKATDENVYNIGIAISPHQIRYSLTQTPTKLYCTAKDHQRSSGNFHSG